MPQLIMVVNDSLEILSLFEALLTTEGYAVTTCGYTVYEVDTIIAAAPDLLIIDQMMPDETPGWLLVQKLRLCRETENLPIIVCTSALETVRPLEAHMQMLNIGLIIKPFSINDILGQIRRTIGGPDVTRQKPDAH